MPASNGSSRFLTVLTAGDSSMAPVLARPAAGGGSGVDVVAAWIDAGCPPPGRPITLLLPPERFDAHPTGTVHGAGSVH